MTYVTRCASIALSSGNTRTTRLGWWAHQLKPKSLLARRVHLSIGATY
ncbi:hypothetical protein VPHK389_0103 [Vibrio phage K389]